MLLLLSELCEKVPAVKDSDDIIVYNAANPDETSNTRKALIQSGSVYKSKESTTLVLVLTAQEAPLLAEVNLVVKKVTRVELKVYKQLDVAAMEPALEVCV